MELMDQYHPKWWEFVDKLAKSLGDPRRCNHQASKTRARAILQTIPNVDVEGTMALFDARGGNCDCEILLNVVEWRDRPGAKRLDD